jgi:hypothetical protein
MQVLKGWRTVERLQQIMKPPPLINALNQRVQSGQYEKIVPDVYGPRHSIDPMRMYESIVGPDLAQQSVAAQFNEIMARKAENPQIGETSLQRVLSGIGPQNYSEDFLGQALKGAKGQFDTLRDVLQTIRKGNLEGANPSGTGAHIIGMMQGAWATKLALDYLIHGQAPDTTDVLSLVAPDILGKILFSKTGIRLVAQGIKAQTPRQIAQIASQMVALMNMPSAAEQDQQRRTLQAQDAAFAAH